VTSVYPQSEIESHLQSAGRSHVGKLVSDAFLRFTAAGLAICFGRAGVDNRGIDAWRPAWLRRHRRRGYVYLLLQRSGASAWAWERSLWMDTVVGRLDGYATVRLARCFFLKQCDASPDLVVVGTSPDMAFIPLSSRRAGLVQLRRIRANENNKIPSTEISANSQWPQFGW
jgi:hypothetical protein